MRVHNLKRQLLKAAAGIVTALMVVVLFVLQFIVIEGNFEFWSSWSFWLNLAVMLIILVVCAEVYWRFGSAGAQRSPKYFNTSIEYSLRVNRIKNSKPNKIDDFYKFVDEKNKELYEFGMLEWLDLHAISRNLYFEQKHNALTRSELKHLKKKTASGKEIPLYTRKQIRAILRAQRGKFPYEKMNGTEILSGMTAGASRYNVHYSARENQLRFTTKNMISSIVLAFATAILVVQLISEWSVAALFLFFYRVFMLGYRALMSYLDGYGDVIDVRRAINNNRINVLVMYASVRELDDLYDSIDEEIAAAKQAYSEELSNG